MGTIVDGEFGSLSFRNQKYLGFDGKDVTFTADLGESMTFSRVRAHFLVSVNDGIHAPLTTQVQYSLDRSQWQDFGEQKHEGGSKHGDAYHLEGTVNSSRVQARHLKFIVQSPKVIPNGYLFAGTDAWILIDEILVQ